MRPKQLGFKAGGIVGYKWDRDTVIAHMRRRLLRGRSLKAADVREESPTLFYAAKYHFGSYGKALSKASDIDGGTGVDSHAKMDKEGLVIELRRLYTMGADLSYTAYKEQPLLRHARRLFGSWRRAIEAAGIDYVEVQRYGWGAARIALQGHPDSQSCNNNYNP